MRSQCFIVHMEIYPFDIMFSINQSDKEFSESIKRKLLDKHYEAFMSDSISKNEDSNVGSARTVRNGTGGQTIVRINHFEMNAQMQGCLAHEIFHAVEFLLRRIGMRLSGKSDEAYAYAIGYLTEEFYKKVKA